MNAAIDALVMLLVLLVGVWVIGFGFTGAVIARNSGASRLAGFSAGVLFGPFGLIWLWWRARDASSPDRGTSTEPDEDTDIISL